MPDAPATPEGQTATTTETTPETTPEGGAGQRSIDSFPPEAQDYIRRLRQEAAEGRNKLKDATGKLKGFEDAAKTDAQKLEDAANEAATRATAAENRALRYEVAAEKDLPLSLAARLQGATKDELSADADKLKADFGIEGGNAGGSAGGPGFDGGVRRPVQRPKSMNGLLRQATGRA